MRALDTGLCAGACTLGGRPVGFRLLTREDTGLWTDFVNACSMDSLWFRFMAPFRATPERALLFCDVDPERELAIAAEMSDQGRRSVIGIARLIRLEDSDRAEFAVIVSDPWQRRTLGTRLSETSMDLGRQWGLGSVFSETALENHAMIKVLKRCRFVVEERNRNMCTLSRKLA